MESCTDTVTPGEPEAVALEAGPEPASEEPTPLPPGPDPPLTATLRRLWVELRDQHTDARTKVKRAESALGKALAEVARCKRLVRATEETAEAVGITLRLSQAARQAEDQLELPGLADEPEPETTLEDQSAEPVAPSETAEPAEPLPPPSDPPAEDEATITDSRLGAAVRRVGRRLHEAGESLPASEPTQCERPRKALVRI